MAESRGVDVKRESDTSLLFEALLLDAGGAKITAASVLPFGVRIWHAIPATGALETYDFNDNTFKVGAVTTPAVVTTHRTVENGTYNTGLHYYRHATLTAFTIGDKYIVEFSHTSLPSVQQREFQYGGVEGDSLQPTTTGLTLDVSATGEAGLDFNNIKQATAPTTLTDITVPVTTTLTNAPLDSAGVTTLLTRVTATLFTGITSMAKWLGLIAGKTADAPALAEINATTAGAGFTNVTDSLEAARDFQTTIPAATAALVPGGVAAVTGTINDLSATTTSFIVNIAASSAVNNFYSGLLSFTSGALVGTGGRTMASYNGTTKRITLYKPLPSAPANGVAFSITADDKTGGQTSTGY